jgi:UDP-N-acetylmuramate dehydrogenase
MILNNISLQKFNTFGLDYKAAVFISVDSEEEAAQTVKSGKEIRDQVLVLGWGSNILFISDFHGTIIQPAMTRIEIEEGHGDQIIISAGAGIIWDNLVEWTVNQGFGGFENLSLIPGTVGATPVQNIGAYCIEVKDKIEKVRAVSLADGTIREFNNDECHFGYRDSIFKNDLKGKYLITRVYYRLSKNPILNTGYGSLHEEVKKLGKLSIRTVREAVINIRKTKLPDPEVIGNAGSFFRNPIVSNTEAASLRKNNPAMPFYPDPSGEIKVAAGWLIEQCGWKGKRFGDAGVHDKQALVLVNYGKATGKEILDLSEKIKMSVFDKFGIKLEMEVEVIGIS